ncbi:MAG TPA: flagellar hook-associated protein FlgK, partial [Acidimicrobiia bacterium]|nr:flagellar hook-associated protein FlgK [Acidimicrobiia bacterium]
MSDFDGLRIALSSLVAQRRALETAGQNVANVNTDGYSRQRVELTAEGGPLAAAIHSRWTGGGLGVRSTGTERLRDQFLELRGYQEHAADAGLARSQGILTRVELAFAEPGDTGLAALLSDFWAGWDDVANRPDDLAARTQLVERATTLANGFHQLDSTMATIRRSSITELQAMVADVNGTADRIAELNAQIQSSVHAGLSPNELMDQRDLLVSGLSEQIGVAVRPNPDGSGMVDVFVGGTALVRGTRAEKLAVTVGTDPAETVRVEWEKDGYPASPTGQAGALLSAVNDVLPRYRAAVAAVAQQVHDDVNALHTGGYAPDGSTGRPFFSMGPEGLEVNAVIAADPRLVAAAGGPGAPRDGSLAQRLAELSGADDTY